MSAEHGFVYCLVNPSMPSLIKVGATIKDPITRARELSAPTSTPLPFVLAYHKAVLYPFQVEADLHRRLESCRTNDSREFFSIELHKVIEMLDKYEEDRSACLSDIETPYADLFASFPDDGSGRELTSAERARIAALEEHLAESRVSDLYA